MDTNVAVIANGTGTNVQPACRLAAIDFLETLVSRGRLVVDVAGDIEAEYKANLAFGQPGVGNRFLQAFLTTAVKRLDRVAIGKNGKGDYNDFPSDRSLQKFDRSDRKFVALGCKSGASVASAVDSDWLEHKQALLNAGLKLHFVCGEDRAKWFA